MPPSAVAINLLLIISFAAVGWLLSRRKSLSLAGLGMGFAILAVDKFSLWRPDLLLACFPFRDFLFYSNFLPFAAALMAPCAFRFSKDKRQRRRMGVLLGILFLLTLKPYADHFREQARSNREEIDENGVCHQSSFETCSAASIVTLAHATGTTTTEARAIELARTKAWGKGTSQYGVYRALRTLGDEQGAFRVRFERRTVPELLDRNTPALITVGLPRGGATPEALAFGQKYMWDPGVYHDVVFLGRDESREGHVKIGDPDVGLERWPVEHLAYLWTGFAFSLEKSAGL